MLRMTRLILFTADCAPGYGLVYGATQSCQLCIIGQYNNKTGENSNICKECPKGYTTNGTGQISCTVEGKYFI